MEKLKETWITDGIIDSEYKRYVLLAYLKNVRKHFTSHRLYPQLAELIVHYNNLLTFKKQQKFVYNRFPKKLTRIDFERLKLNYEQIIKDDDVIR